MTGVRKELSRDVRELILRARMASSGRIPLAVGFGISLPRHIREVLGWGADEAIVGSAFIDIISENRGKKERMLREIDRFAGEMKAATRNFTRFKVK